MIKKLFNQINNLRSPNETGDKVSNIIDFIDKNKLSLFIFHSSYLIVSTALLTVHQIIVSQRFQLVSQFL